VTSGTYHLGEAIGARRRLLVGAVPTGSRIALSSQDRQHRQIYFFGCDEPEVTAVVTRLLRPGSTFFDVGANAGWFTLIARDLGADVHAFEPNPAILALLERSRAFDPERITIVPAACSDASGTLPLYLLEDTNSGMASLDKPAGRRVDVPVVTIADHAVCVGATPDLIKIDVEGHEYWAVTGALPLLDGANPVLIVETTEERTVALLADHGYTASALTPDGRRPLRDDDLAAAYCNVLFERA
jgi:FkbM family methyltransferase